MVFNQDTATNGINELALDKLIIEVCDRADNLNSILNSIDDEIYRSLNSVDSIATTQFRYVYEEMKKNYNIVNQNILSYSTDYAKIKNAYNERSSAIVGRIKEATENVKQTNIYEERR